MVNLAGKVKAAMMVVAASSPSKVVGGLYFSRENLPVFPLSRWHRSCSRSVFEKKSGGGGEENQEGRAMGDIKVHNRVTGENLQFDDVEKKSWWMPNPLTGVFVPHEEKTVHATMEENETTVQSSE